MGDNFSPAELSAALLVGAHYLVIPTHFSVTESGSTARGARLLGPALTQDAVVVERPLIPDGPGAMKNDPCLCEKA